MKSSAKTRQEILSLAESMGGGRTYNYKTRQTDHEPISRSFIERVETQERDRPYRDLPYAVEEIGPTLFRSSELRKQSELEESPGYHNLRTFNNTQKCDPLRLTQKNMNETHSNRKYQ